MLDVQILRCIAIAFGLLFLLAGLHKLSQRAHFAGVMADYRVLPESLLPLAVFTVPLLELSLGIAWLGTAIILQTVLLVPLASALLLITYALAIALNLARGRRHIDCGCSFSSNHSNSETGYSLSAGLVVRNLLLAALAATPLLGTNERELILIDHVLLLLATLVLIFLYAGLNQLLANQGAIDSWRKVDG